MNADGLATGEGVPTAWCSTCETELSPGARGTGCPRSSSLAGPGPSAVAALLAAPANMASQRLSELCYGSGIYFEMQPGLLCACQLSLGSRDHSAVGSCLFRIP